MSRIVVLYHSRTGNTEKMAREVAAGAPDKRAVEGCRELGKRVACLAAALAGKEMRHCRSAERKSA